MHDETHDAVVLRREPLGDGTWTWSAYRPDLPGAESDGATPEEAVANLEEARTLSPGAGDP
jgi:predicted RNase H-like HicB family nuclease